MALKIACLVLALAVACYAHPQGGFGADTAFAGADGGLRAFGPGSNGNGFGWFGGPGSNNDHGFGGPGWNGGAREEEEERNKPKNWNGGRRKSSYFQEHHW